MGFLGAGEAGDMAIAVLAVMFGRLASGCHLLLTPLSIVLGGVGELLHVAPEHSVQGDTRPGKYGFGGRLLAFRG